MQQPGTGNSSRSNGQCTLVIHVFEYLIRFAFWIPVLDWLSVALNVAVAAPLACLSLSSSIGVLGGTTPARCLAVAAGGGRGGGQEEDG